MIVKSNQFWCAFHLEVLSVWEWVAEWNRVTVTKIAIINASKSDKVIEK